MTHKLSQWQLSLTVINFIVGNSLLFAPGITALHAKTDGWLAVFLATAVGMACNGAWIFLLSKYNYMSIFEISDLVIGKWLGKIVTVALIFFAVHLCAVVVRDASDFMVDVVMPETGPWLYQVGLLALAAYSVHHGVTNIGKVNEVLSPLMLVCFVGSGLLVANQMKLQHLQPFFAQGMAPIWHGAFPLFGFLFLPSFYSGHCLRFLRTKHTSSGHICLAC